MKMQKYDSIYCFRFIAMCMVLILHGSLPDGLAGPVQAVCRIAVPFFFLVSGFFSVKEEGESISRKKRVKKLGLLLLEISLVYYAFWMTKLVLGTVDLETIRSDFGAGFWLLNISFMTGHLWFVRALIYLEVFYITSLSAPFRGEKGWILALLVWFLDVLFMKYGLLVLGFQMPEPYFEVATKFYGTALVYYTLGLQLRIHKEAVLKKVRPILPIIWGFFLMACLVLNCSEYYMLEWNGVNTMPCNYLFNFILCMGIFLFLMAYPEFLSGSRLCEWGRVYSGPVYYWHLLVRALNEMVLKRMHFSVMVYRNPLLMLVETMILVKLFMMIRSSYKKEC